MRVGEILRRLLRNCRSVHAKRIAALVAAVKALAGGGRLTLTDLGRAIAGRGSHKHAIKRIDRLLGNRKLFSEMPEIVKPFARAVVGSCRRPLICIDWTGAADGLWALVAAVPVAGRAIPVWFEVHPKSAYNSRRAHNRFLDRLASLLPADCCPIIVADAGFQRPFFRKVEELGWGFVIRVRGKNRRLGYFRHRYGEVLATALNVPRELEDCIDNFDARVVLGAKPSPSGRKRSRSSASHERQAKEPWLLATNLWRHEPEEVVSIYATRMRIEEHFRDTKSHRLGWGFEDAKNRSPERVAVLLLIGALATFVVIVAGLTAERKNLAKLFQANTTQTRRVISVFNLGRYVLNHPLHERLKHHWRRSLQHLPKMASGGVRCRVNGCFGDAVYARTHLPF